VKDPRIVPDMGVRVSFLEDKAPVAKSRTLPGVLVPATAIRNKGDASAVFIVKNGHARERKVTLGQSFGDARQVLSGLDRGDQVIVAAPAALRDGDPVRIE
jgi:multidrug efflux pump subunit AcrA (membrane-fusion protein)